jgi:uncharacterized membrane protein
MIFFLSKDRRYRSDIILRKDRNAFPIFRSATFFCSRMSAVHSGILNCFLIYEKETSVKIHWGKRNN